MIHVIEKLNEMKENLIKLSVPGYDIMFIFSFTFMLTLAKALHLKYVLEKKS